MRLITTEEYRRRTRNIVIKKDIARWFTISEIEQFFDLTDMTGECWIWKREIGNNHYPRFARRGRDFFCHRISYELFKGDIPEGMTIDHLCYNHNCINPEHLEAVTSSENSRRYNARVVA